MHFMQPKKQEFYKHINGQFILHSRLRATKQEGNHNPTSPISNVHRKVVHLIDHRFTRIKLNRINCTKIYRFSLFHSLCTNTGVLCTTTRCTVQVRLGESVTGPQVTSRVHLHSNVTKKL